MRTALIFIGVMIALYGAYSVVYAEDALTGALMALLALAVMVATSDTVWRGGE